MPKRKTTQEFKNEMLLVNPNIEVLGEYKGCKQKILVKNKICNHEWRSQPSNLLNGCGCPKCLGKNKTTKEFIKEMEKINPNIIILGEYVNSTTKILVKNKLCGHEWDSSTPHNLSLGVCCPICTIQNRIIDKTGEINYNNNKEKMSIINYINATNIDVIFEDGTVVKHKYYSNFVNGTITNPNYKSLYGVGFLGKGSYVTGENYKHIVKDHINIFCDFFCKSGIYDLIFLIVNWSINSC
jgi:hypothetical protein